MLDLQSIYSLCLKHLNAGPTDCPISRCTATSKSRAARTNGTATRLVGDNGLLQLAK